MRSECGNTPVHRFEMKMKIVTSGSAYLDIDAYAGCIACAELLNVLGEPAKALSSAPLNDSICASLRAGHVGLEAHVPDPSDTFVLVDVSHPAYLDPIVEVERVVAVYDHHSGAEAFWHARLGERARIEHVGAAATQIYEAWLAAGALAQMRPATARLLLAAILDNTLNFGAQVTTARDHAAYAALAPLAGVGDGWPAAYFSECQAAIERDLGNALRNDAKTLSPTAERPAVLAQLVIWDARRIMAHQHARIRATLGALHADWLLNLVSIDEQRSYFLADNDATRSKVAKALAVDFSGGPAPYERLILRKELMRLPAFAAGG